jgi:rubrerythrin
MQLDRLLCRCRGLEARAAAVYRTFAARTRDDPAICATWTALARDEDAHAHALARAESWLDAPRGWQTSLDGWNDELAEIERRLANAERPEIGADVERQLVAAIALERTELDTLYHRLLSLIPLRDRLHADGHTGRLLALAAQHDHDPAVAMEAALLRARLRLRKAS